MLRRRSRRGRRGGRWLWSIRRGVWKECIILGGLRVPDWSWFSCLIDWGFSAFLLMVECCSAYVFLLFGATKGPDLWLFLLSESR